MDAWTIIVGLMIAVNVTAAILSGMGKKALRRTVARLEKVREERVARLKVFIKRRKSMDGTRNFMRRRRDDLKRLVGEQEEEFQRLESGEEAEAEAESDEGAEGAEGAEADGQDGGVVGAEDDKPISSWMDRKEEAEKEKSWREEKQIRTRGHNDRGEGVF